MCEVSRFGNRDGRTVDGVVEVRRLRCELGAVVEDADISAFAAACLGGVVVAGESTLLIRFRIELVALRSLVAAITLLLILGAGELVAKRYAFVNALAVLLQLVAPCLNREKSWRIQITAHIREPRACVCKQLAYLPAADNALHADHVNSEVEVVSVERPRVGLLKITDVDLLCLRSECDRGVRAVTDVDLLRFVEVNTSKWRTNHAEWRLGLGDNQCRATVIAKAHLDRHAIAGCGNTEVHVGHRLGIVTRFSQLLDLKSCLRCG